MDVQKKAAIPIDLLKSGFRIRDRDAPPSLKTASGYDFIIKRRS
jgi:hypothetical protein